MQQLQRPRRLAGPRRQQPAALEDAVELIESGAVPQFLEVEFFVAKGPFFAVVQANRAKIANDSPRAARQGVEIVPALLDRGAAVGAVAVEVGRRPFKLDHGQRHVQPRKLAQGRVGSPHVIDVELVFHLPIVGAGRLDLITQSRAEKLAQELLANRLFFELQEYPAGFQIGPMNGDFIGPILGCAGQLDLHGGLQQESRDEQRPLAAPPPLQVALLLLKLPRVGFEEACSGLHGVFALRHITTPSSPRYMSIRSSIGQTQAVKHWQSPADLAITTA